MHRLLNMLLIMVGLLVMLACGGDTDDRMLRRVRQMPDGHQHRSVSHDDVSGASGTVPLSAEAMEERVRGSTGERGAQHGEDQGRLRPLL